MASKSDIYVCKESAMVPYLGQQTLLSKGQTRVRAGHELLDLFPQLFEPITVHYDVEQATRGPGERRTSPRKNADE